MGVSAIRPMDPHLLTLNHAISQKISLYWTLPEVKSRLKNLYLTRYKTHKIKGMIINPGHGPKFVPEKYYDTHGTRNDNFLIGFDLNEYHFDRIFKDVHPRIGKACFFV